MFEEPSAKRVRREDLYGSSGSDDGSSSDGASTEKLRARLNAQVAKSLNLGDLSEDHRPSASSGKKNTVGVKLEHKDHSSSESNDDTDHLTSEREENDGDEDDEAYAFRLFSTSDAVTKVVIKDDEELLGDGAIQNPRPSSFYLVTDLPARVKEQYSFAALTGDDVYALSKRRCWGLEMPWRVKSIRATGTQKTTSQGDGRVVIGEDADKEERKRKRPGKKKRVKMRTREKAKKAKAEVAAQQAVEKEEHMKDKKKRMNRLKKLRRRAKDKEKKTAAGEGAEETESDGSD